MITVARARCRSAWFGALLGVMLASKALASSVVPPAGTRILFLPWDDVAVAGALAWLLASLGRWWRALVAILLLLFHAFAMLLVQALGQPFLPSMLAGCAPAMGDSVAPYLTLANAAKLGCLLGCGGLGAWSGRRVVVGRPALLGATTLAAAAALLAPGPTPACHRNALVAFARGLVARSGDVPAATEACWPQQAPLPLGLPPGIAAGRSVVLVVLESAATRFVAPAAPPSPMPFLRRLAGMGCDCTAAYAVYPESIEGQVPILCGLPPRPGAVPGDYGACARHSLAHRLRAHGYRSGLFHAGRFQFLGMNEVLAEMGFDLLADAATIRGRHEASFGIDEEATVDALLAWLAGQPQDQRVLACWLPIAGHHPYGSPSGGPFPRDTMVGCYQNALHYADRSLARLWHGLCAMRPPEHWLLCVVGDHGQAFGEHAGNFGHSFELYEENLRVPLVFMAPGSALVGRYDEPCSHLDLVPTLMSLLGHVAAPAPVFGRAPLPVHAFTDWGELLVATRLGRWKLIHDVAAGCDRLFDLARDPEERTDLAAQQPEVAAELRREALQFLRGARALVR